MFSSNYFYLIIRQEDQKNKNNKKTKMWRKTTVWTFQATNKWNLIQENSDMANK